MPTLTTPKNIISIHAPRAGSDLVLRSDGGLPVISIHAPRAGSDPTALATPFDRLVHFNPRSPCGERRVRVVGGKPVFYISIHAPRAGSDRRSY